MADSSSRSYLRVGHGPRPVESGTTGDRFSGSSRRRRDGDERSSGRSKRDATQRTPKKDGHRRKSSTTYSVDSCAERPYFELDVIGQPSKSIVLGQTIETSLLLSLRLPAVDRSITPASIDCSRLFAVVSLVADNRNGERVPLEAGVMAGQKMFDSVHPILADYTARLSNNEPCRLALGYFTFPSMLIRQSGTYRIRTTLIKMSAAGEGGGMSILTTDSETIKVERRASSNAQRRQRMAS